MTEAQINAIIDLLSRTTHALVRSNHVSHAEKVEMLDSLSTVKREFGVVEMVGEPE